jgi:hypothetical protein
MAFSGRGTVKYVPDVANLNFGVKVDNKAKADEALKELNSKIDKIMVELEKVGLTKDKIQTQNYVLNPHYEAPDGINKLTGYDANEILIVKIENIDENPNRIAEIVNTVSLAGSNQINGLSFEPSNLEDLKQEARLLAIADARKKANDLANTMDVDLGKVISWWENYLTPSYQYSYDMGGGYGGGGAVSTPTGNYEVVVEANISYKVK